MQEKDVLRRFLFDGLAVRGEWLNLTGSWQAAKQHHQYPEAITTQLGQALVAATLLSATIKFEGNLILQAQGTGALKSLVAQSTNTREIRGWARYDEQTLDNDSPASLNEGRLVITIEPKKGEPYQGIVPITGEHFADAVETYFAQSEQLKTRLWLFANNHQAVGLLLQELPSEGGESDQEDWNRIEHLASTITEQELLDLSCVEVLHRLFNEEPLRLFDAEATTFKCRCSAEKVETTLLSLGREAVDDILEEQNEVVADCEFCSTKYHFDKVDIERVFSEAIIHPHSNTQH